MKLLKFSVIFLIIAACATIPHQDRQEKLLLEHLQSWQGFQADGIVSVNYENFVFRKSINIKKTASDLKITVYDAGIFGLNPQPFLTVKIDSLIQIQAQSGEPEYFAFDSLAGLEILMEPLLLLPFKEQIIKQKNLRFDQNTVIHFSRQMKIDSIEQISQQFSIDFSYRTELAGISIRQANRELVKIEIDKFIHLPNRNE